MDKAIHRFYRWMAFEIGNPSPASRELPIAMGSLLVGLVRLHSTVTKESPKVGKCRKVAGEFDPKPLTSPSISLSLPLGEMSPKATERA